MTRLSDTLLRWKKARFAFRLEGNRISPATHFLTSRKKLTCCLDVWRNEYRARRSHPRIAIPEPAPFKNKWMLLYFPFQCPCLRTGQFQKFNRAYTTCQKMKGVRDWILTFSTDFAIKVARSPNSPGPPGSRGDG